MPSPDLKKETKAYALQQGVDLIGFVSAEHLNEVTPTRYKPSRLWPEAKTVISIGKRLLMGAVAVGTGEMVQNARWVAWRTNEYLNSRAMEIAHFLERQGARAFPMSNGTMVDPDFTNLGIYGELSHRHVAAEAGLGTIGVPTYIVTPQFGPRIYFNTILTDAELEPDPKLDFDPCGDGCNKCVKACPNGAISRGRKLIKKRLCIPSAMPHGVRVLQEYIRKIMEEKDPEERIKLLEDFDFARLHRATVQGVGTIAGCFHCLAACPIGRNQVT
ncbi:4Fe-4S binding protein [bacterium]|nr:4Fe-4S binding protein [bacterium]